MFPISRSVYEAFSLTSGVAPVTASPSINLVAVHEVIFEVNESINTIRPRIAGFAKFCPNPPKSCFAITTATKQPIRACHKGSSGGRFIARSIPVTAALKSVIVCSRFMIILHKPSIATEPAMHTRVRISALIPNITIPVTREGRSAIITYSITFCVVMLLVICGDADTFNIISFLSTYLWG